MLNTKKLTVTQLGLVKEIIKFYNGRRIITRTELREAHTALRKRVSSPYFIAKNSMAKAHGKDAKAGQYDLGQFLVFAKTHKPAAGRKEAGPRREASNTKGKRSATRVAA